jgi:hypothetical protein
LETAQLREKIAALALRNETGILISSDINELISIAYRYVESSEKIEEFTKLIDKHERVISAVRDFLIDLHRGNRDLSQNLKDINISMLFLENHDYIEQGPRAK